MEEDGGKYDKLTFWEQVDGGVYATGNRRLFMVMPVVLFVLATHGTDFRKQPLGLNLAVVLLCVIAKLPALHKVTGRGRAEGVGVQLPGAWKFQLSHGGPCAGRALIG